MKYRYNPSNYSLPKKIVIRLTPSFIYDGLLYAEDLYAIFLDRIRFMRTRSKKRSKGRYQLESRMTYYAHSLEKGLSHADIRYNFGNKALKALSSVMAAYREAGYSGGAAYNNALSVLREYINIHESADQPYDILRTHFDKAHIKEIMESRSEVGGTKIILGRDKKHNESKNFKDLFLGRYSVREFKDAPIDVDKINDAISIATKTPTVCNRQAVRVRVVTESEAVAKVLKIQAGLHGYETPPSVIIITADNGGYVELFERNQSYVDGGAFSMALLLALEYKGLAACSLNAMFRRRVEKRMRKELGIDINENIIMLIAAGEFKEETKVPKSFRYSPDDIMRKIS